MNVADSKTKKMKMKVEVGRHGESMIWANDVMLKDSSLLGNKRCHASFFRQPTILDNFESVCLRGDLVIYARFCKDMKSKHFD